MCLALSSYAKNRKLVLRSYGAFCEVLSSFTASFLTEKGRNRNCISFTSLYRCKSKSGVGFTMHEDGKGHAGQSFQALGLKCPVEQKKIPTICKPLQNSRKCLQSSVTVETCFLSEIRENRPRTRADQTYVSLSLTFSTCLHSSQVTAILPLIKDSTVPG